MERVPGTTKRIVEAARRAVVEHGPAKLTLSAVAAEAGVSRPTLYRWFPTKANLLAAISAYEVERFDSGLRATIESHRSPQRRLDAAVRYIIGYLDDAIGPESIQADAAFALRSIAEALGPQTRSLTGLLGEALDEVPAVASGVLSRAEAAELFLRVAYSHYLVPHRDVDELMAILRGFAGMGARRTGRASARDRRLVS